MNEIPMYSPHPNGKLYSRATFAETVNFADTVGLVAELNKYTNYRKIKWVLETAPTDGDTQPIDGLIIDTGYVTIKTNCVFTIRQGDVIMLPPTVFWSKEQAFMVSDEVQKSYTYTPKARLLFQHISLQALL